MGKPADRVIRRPGMTECVGFDVVCHQCGRTRWHTLLIAVTPWWWRRDAWFGRVLWSVRFGKRRPATPAEDDERRERADHHRARLAGLRRRHWPTHDTVYGRRWLDAGPPATYAPFIDLRTRKGQP